MHAPLALLRGQAEAARHCAAAAGAPPPRSAAAGGVDADVMPAWWLLPACCAHDAALPPGWSDVGGVDVAIA
jgi:hypothetical protein